MNTLLPVSLVLIGVFTLLFVALNNVIDFYWKVRGTIQKFKKNS